MARRSIEMHEYRQALMRLRQGDSEREIARSGLIDGTGQGGPVHTLAQSWIEPSRPLPPDTGDRPPRPAGFGPHRPTPLVECWLGRASPMWRPTPRRPGARARLYRPRLQRPSPYRATSRAPTSENPGRSHAQPIPPSTLRAKFRSLKTNGSFTIETLIWRTKSILIA